mmetsp:Transcript_128547/g.357857  ORF Transcript_128547/g.357857 Transcript_128547/m.357857 type:complete len:202 (-) Transcript_128547:1539-2144(-)
MKSTAKIATVYPRWLNAHVCTLSPARKMARKKKKPHECRFGGAGPTSGGPAASPPLPDPSCQREPSHEGTRHQSRGAYRAPVAAVLGVAAILPAAQAASRPAERPHHLGVLASAQVRAAARDAPIACCCCHSLVVIRARPGPGPGGLRVHVNTGSWIRLPTPLEGRVEEVSHRGPGALLRALLKVEVVGAVLGVREAVIRE